MTNDEERSYLLQQIRWELMRCNEAVAEIQRNFYNLQVTSQALIDHMEGNDNAIRGN